MFNKRRKLFNMIEHRNGLTNLYENQLEKTDSLFMKMVLKEALRKLKESELPPKKIENWVVRLEKNWRNI